MTRSLALAVLTLLLSGPASGANWWVDPAAAPGGGGTSPGDAFVEIDDALASAAAGDTIRLLPGTHDGPSNWITLPDLHITGAPTGAATLTTPPQIFNHVFDLYADGIRVSNLTIQGHPGLEDTGVVIYGDRASVVNCQFIDVARPVEIYGIDARILANTFADYSANAVHTERGGSHSGATLIKANSFTGAAPITPYATTGVRVSDQGGQAVRVEDNAFFGIPGDGHVAVTLQGGRAIVLRNSFADVDLGVSLAGGSRHVVSSNVFDGVPLGLRASVFDTRSSHLVVHNTFVGNGASPGGTTAAVDCVAYTNLRVANNLILASDVGLRTALPAECRVLAQGNVFSLDVDLAIEGDVLPPSSENQIDVDVVLDTDYTPLQPPSLLGILLPPRPYYALDLYGTPRGTPGTVGAVEQP